MNDWQTLSHVRWDCKYHVIIMMPSGLKRGGKPVIGGSTRETRQI